MLKNIALASIFLFFLTSCTSRVVRGELQEQIEFCGEFLGTKCANGTFVPSDNLIVFEKEGKDGLLFEYNQKIADEVAGRTCDFVVEGQKIKSYSDCK
jgi:hypothetical protein